MSENLVQTDHSMEHIGNIFRVVRGPEHEDRESEIDHGLDQNDCISTMTPFFAQERLH